MGIVKFAIFIEAPPYHRRQQNRAGFARPDLGYEAPQIGLEGIRWRVALWLGLRLVVVSELNEHIVTVANLFQQGVPTSFLNERPRAAAVFRVVDDHDIVYPEPVLQRLAPACFRTLFRKLFRDGGIAGKEYPDGIFRECRIDRNGQQHRSQQVIFQPHGFVPLGFSG